MEKDFEQKSDYKENPKSEENGLRQDVTQENSELLEPELEPVFDFRYTLSEQEYIDFNLMLFERNMAK